MSHYNKRISSEEKATTLQPVTAKTKYRRVLIHSAVHYGKRVKVY